MSKSSDSLFQISGGCVLLILLCIVGIPLGFVLHGCDIITGTTHKAMDVAAAQFDPATMLKRYEWFKDAAAMCDKKRADLTLYESRFKQLQADYAGKPRNEWAREDREQYNMWLSECSGIAASYNTLAAEYNSAMAKMNYSFTNIGELPRGVSEPLPREFKPYMSAP